MKSFVMAMLIASGTLLVSPASANQRHYTYTYETATLPMGTAEIEPWTTVRLMREDYYVRFDHRLEFEVGLLDHFQAALYLNWFEIAAADHAADNISESFGFKGIALELKGKLLDPVADPIGLGLYFEIGGTTTELELEGKLLLDKVMGNVGVAFNVVYELELEATVDGPKDETNLEIKAHELQFDLGVAWFISQRWSLALELVSRTEFAKDEKDDYETVYSILSLGPTVTYGGEHFWIATTVLPQIAALKGATGDSIQHLEDKEALEIRLLLGFDI
ncbi:MAG: hypothetical protein IV100_05980 [Myxococcales bacterium]|nr:hypothetical protein [Myxococcales bacterium]